MECINDGTHDKLFKSLASVFQEAQSTYAGHRRHAAVLRKIQEKANDQSLADAFNYWFDRLVARVLPLKRQEVTGDRIVRLVGLFVAQAADNLMTSFVDQFVRYTLRGAESRDKNVRFRVCQLLAVVMDNLGEIDESLYKLVLWCASKRVNDREPSVRVQAVFCLTKFQDDEIMNSIHDANEATKILLRLVQNDPAAEVRRAAMLNLIQQPCIRPYSLERARDVNSINRRLVYSRIMRSWKLVIFERVERPIIDEIMKWGLEDREESVRNACIKLITHDWINLMDGDLIKLVEKLDVTKSKFSVKAVQALLKVRPDIISNIKFPDELWKELTVELAFLFRIVYTHCTDNGMIDAIDSNFPESANLSKIIQFYIDLRLNSNLNRADRAALEFILEQLLITANQYDYSDEVGRRSMLNVIRNMLAFRELPRNLIQIGHKVLRTLSISEKDFVSMAVEIINDIRDDDIEKQEIIEKNKSNDQSDRSDNDDDDDALSSFHSAVENLVSGKGPNTEDEILRRLPREREASPETIKLCLERSSCMLELVGSSLIGDIMISSLVDTLIMPAVRNNDTAIRELGVRNLGLCCLLDIQLATENMYILGMCVSKGTATLKKTALEVIMDIFSVHGTAVVDGEGKVDSISLHKIFYKVLKNYELPECQVIVAEGLCKLFLTDIFNDDDLFETLVLSYFAPGNTCNEALIQAFAFCIPVYCFSHANHQQRMARIAADILLRLCMLWDNLMSSDASDEEKGAMMKPNVIFQQLIYWTDPTKRAKQTEDEASRDNVQLKFLIDVLRVLSRMDTREIKKMVMSNINSFILSPNQDPDLLKQIDEYINDVIENDTLDSVSRNALHKFHFTLKDILNVVAEKASNSKADISSSFDENYSVILESSNFNDISLKDDEQSQTPDIVEDDISATYSNQDPNSGTQHFIKQEPTSDLKHSSERASVIPLKRTRDDNTVESSKYHVAIDTRVQEMMPGYHSDMSVDD